MKGYLIIFNVLGLFVAALVAAAETPQSIAAPKSIETFFNTYCYTCHDTETMKADLSLEDLTRTITNSTDAQHWQDILDQLNAGEMPPKKKKKQPSREELSLAIGDLTDVLAAAQEMLKDSGGEIALRRLNRREYEATVEDLMGVRLDGGKLPDDPSGRFDTIGRNQSLNAMQLQGYFSFGQEVSKMALYWATQPRDKVKTIRESWINKAGRPKEIYELVEKTDLVKKEGKTPAEAGLTEEEWEKYNPDGPNAQNSVWRGQHQYYKNNLATHEKGFMLAHDLLVNSVNVRFQHDARATYIIRAKGGVAEGVKTRRLVRLMRDGSHGGKHGIAFGSFLMTGSFDDLSVHELEFSPRYPPEYRSNALHFVYLLEDKRGGPGFEQMYHHYKSIEPGAPRDAILMEWVEMEGPFYKDKTAFELLVDKYKIASASEEELDDISKDFLADFAKQAFRHQKDFPISFINKIHGYYKGKRKSGASFQEAIVDPLAMILTSPRFLYLIEPQTVKGRSKLDAITLANRLSYFLWSSPPDSELYKLAQSGNLLKTGVLDQQVERMLKSPKAEVFFEGFMSQWMHLNRFDAVGLNSKLLVTRTDAMIYGSRREPIEFFKTIVRGNLSASNFIDSDFVMADAALAMRYGLTQNYSGDGFKKVQLPKTSARGGIITQAAFLSSGTMGNRTSPVIRGAMVKEILLNDAPPPPPPNVPELVRQGVDPLSSVRSLVDLHQQKVQCASCHARFDAYGLGLEHFDAVGVWRDKELVTLAEESQQIPRKPKREYPVDASGTLPNGTIVKDIFGLKKALMKDQRKVAASVFEGLLCYALGRDVSFTDSPMIKGTLDQLSEDNYRLQEMIKAIVSSKTFLEY